MLPLFLHLKIPSNLSRALSCLRLSGHNFLVQRMRYDRNRRPYELRICDRCDWHAIQDEEHILLDCPHDHLVRLRTQQQFIFPPQFEDGPARLRTFMNQPDIFGVEFFVAKCLALFPWFFLAVFFVWLQAFFQASAQMPTRGIYSDVTLPYLFRDCMGVSCMYELFKLGMLIPCKSLLQIWSIGWEVFGETLSWWTPTRITTNWPPIFLSLPSLFLEMSVCQLMYHGISILICPNMLCAT